MIFRILFSCRLLPVALIFFLEYMMPVRSSVARQQFQRPILGIPEIRFAPYSIIADLLHDDLFYYMGFLFTLDVVSSYYEEKGGYEKS